MFFSRELQHRLEALLRQASPDGAASHLTLQLLGQRVANLAARHPVAWRAHLLEGLEDFLVLLLGLEALLLVGVTKGVEEGVEAGVDAAEVLALAAGVVALEFGTRGENIVSS